MNEGGCDFNQEELKSSLKFKHFFQNQNKMKVLVVLVGLAAVLANVEAGGYTAKGGVYDFKKPLDYLDQAVNAGINFNKWVIHK